MSRRGVLVLGGFGVAMALASLFWTVDWWFFAGMVSALAGSELLALRQRRARRAYLQSLPPGTEPGPLVD